MSGVSVVVSGDACCSVRDSSSPMIVEHGPAWSLLEHIIGLLTTLNKCNLDAAESSCVSYVVAVGVTAESLMSIVSLLGH